MRRPRALVIGGGGREHAIGAALVRSEAQLHVAAPQLNPGLKPLAHDHLKVPVEDAEKIAAYAKARGIELAVLGPEAAIAAGVADRLRAVGVPTVGPNREAGRIETSKAFARDLLARHKVPGLPRYALPKDAAEARAFVEGLGGTPFVVKPVGLAGGKGVWVQGADFPGTAEGLAYAEQLRTAPGSAGVVLEERLEGEEFSLMAFVDGSRVFPMPVVQDYKRALEGNGGGNTGGMGSYSERDGLLPFLTRDEHAQAVSILEQTLAALKADGLDFRGVLYGGFLLTAQGPRVLEFNARFGDPEALNVLTLYDGTDFADLLLQVATGSVDPSHVGFRRRATVVKYLVPPGYGSAPVAGGTLKLDLAALTDLAVTPYFGAVTAGAGQGTYVHGTSRGVALVGEASARKDAEARVEAALQHVQGTYYVRHDVGSAADVKARVDHMARLRGDPGFAPERNPTRSGPTPPPIFV